MKNRETVSENIRYFADRVFPAGFSFFLFLSVFLYESVNICTHLRNMLTEKRKRHIFFLRFI